MEDLAFFNEREAECFEREDTLSQTDLEKLNVAEDMPEIERAEHLLMNGLDKQKISVLASISKILASTSNCKSSLSLILDSMKAVWLKSDGDSSFSPANNSSVRLEVLRAIASLACATVDGKVLSCPMVCFHDDYVRQVEAGRGEKKDAVFLLSDEQVAKQLLPLALDLVSETQQKDYAEAASLAVICCLPRLAGTIKKTQFIRVAMEKGDVSQPPGSRLLCCLLLGAVTASNVLTAQDIECLYLTKMMALCQDTDAEVRKCMCVQLDALARAIGEERACSELLPELLELLQDEEEQVKQSAFLALLSLLDFFPHAERVKRVVPEFQNIAESLPDYLLGGYSEHFGSLVTKLAALNYLVSDTASSFLQSYSKLCSREEVHIRAFCAYNFPAVVKAFGTMFTPVLVDDLLVKLSRDAMGNVRSHIAAGLHEVALLLGPQRAVRYLKPVVLALLKDDASSVHGMMISRIPSLMSTTFAIGDSEEQKAAMVDATLRSIVQYHGVLPASRNRDQLAFVETLMQFPMWCTSEQMYEMVIPIIFDLIEDGARPVQMLAIQTLVRCIRRNENSSHRFSLLSKLRTEYGHSKSYWRRLLYLEACSCALEINSRQYCRLNFLDIGIELLDDVVPNVRLKAASLVPFWKVILTALSDDKMLDRIRQFLEECSIDNDRDVANSISDAKVTIESNELGNNQQRRIQDDAEDKRRVAEEENLGLTSDHEDSSSDSKWSSMLEYTLVVGKDGQVVRRARVKSLDLANKLSGRPQGKDTSRGVGTIGGLGSSTLSSVNASSIGSLSSMGTKVDPSKTKLAPKTPSKPPGVSMTTLPNCPTARPPNAGTLSAAKMPPGIRVAGSTGKLNPSGSKSATGSSRSSAALTKDTAAMTKIPIIRPSAPAKRENSPSTGTKPSNSLAPTSYSGMSTSSTLGGGSANGPQGSALVAATMKNKLGSLDSSSVGASGTLALKPKVAAPSSASSKR